MHSTTQFPMHTAAYVKYIFMICAAQCTFAMCTAVHIKYVQCMFVMCAAAYSSGTELCTVG